MRPHHGHSGFVRGLRPAQSGPSFFNRSPAPPVYRVPAARVYDMPARPVYHVPAAHQADDHGYAPRFPRVWRNPFAGFFNRHQPEVRVRTWYNPFSWAYGRPVQYAMPQPRVRMWVWYNPLSWFVRRPAPDYVYDLPQPRLQLRAPVWRWYNPFTWFCRDDSPQTPTDVQTPVVYQRDARPPVVAAMPPASPQPPVASCQSAPKDVGVLFRLTECSEEVQDYVAGLRRNQITLSDKIKAFEATLDGSLTSEEENMLQAFADPITLAYIQIPMSLPTSAANSTSPSVRNYIDLASLFRLEQWENPSNRQPFEVSDIQPAPDLFTECDKVLEEIKANREQQASPSCSM